MEPCCALKYYPDIELCVNEMLGEEKSKDKQQRREKEENFGDSTLGKIPVQVREKEGNFMDSTLGKIPVQVREKEETFMDSTLGKIHRRRKRQKRRQRSSLFLFEGQNLLNSLTR